ncbi:MAG: DUF4364 family protein [Bacillota bacterium]|nr:DUF4364 family protein [Bacillota bacterium]
MRPVVKRPMTIKLVILYILSSYKKSMPESALSNIMLEDIDVNYFDFRQCLSELEDVFYVHTFMENGHEYHQLTNEGKMVIDELYKKVAFQLRDEIVDYIKREKRKISRSNEFECDILPVSDTRFNVRVSYTEADEELLTLTFYAGSREAACAMVTAINKNRNKLYADLNFALSNSLNLDSDSE